jgi:hypothetical protein
MKRIQQISTYAVFVSTEGSTMRQVILSPRSRLRLLIYGRAGSGKTTFAGSAAKDERTAPVLWLDAGGNPIVLTRLSLTADDLRLKILGVDQLSELAAIYNWFRDGQDPKNIVALENGLKPPYKTLVFDGITHLQRLSFDAIMGTGDLAPGLIPPKPEWGHYRSVLGQMIGIASKYYTLPLHIIVTALEHPEQRFLVPGESSTQYIFREPLLAGQSVDEFPGWALNVGRMALTSTYEDKVIKANGAADSYSLLQFKATRFVDAKDQHNFGPFHADPTVKKLLDIMDAKAPPQKQ